MPCNSEERVEAQWQTEYSLLKKLTSIRGELLATKGMPFDTSIIDQGVKRKILELRNAGELRDWNGIAEVDVLAEVEGLVAVRKALVGSKFSYVIELEILGVWISTMSPNHLTRLYPHRPTSESLCTGQCISRSLRINSYIALRWYFGGKMIDNPWSSGWVAQTESLFARQDPAAVEGLTRMTELRAKLGDPKATGLDTSNLDLFIEDMAERLGKVVEEHYMAYIGKAKALYNDLGC